jgi:hypothetical protein
VLACRCFLPNRFLSSRLAKEYPTFSRAPSRRPGFYAKSSLSSLL